MPRLIKAPKVKTVAFSARLDSRVHTALIRWIEAESQRQGFDATQIAAVTRGLFRLKGFPEIYAAVCKEQDNAK